jgi:hypothetical protein
MTATASRALTASSDPSELDALLSAISDAIEALVAWDVTAFQSAVERQSAICDRLAAVKSGGSPSPEDADAVHRIQELNRVYDCLLQHSVQWTRTLCSILRAGGHPLTNRATLHFRA